MLTINQCRYCGAKLEKEGKKYTCIACGNEFLDESASDTSEQNLIMADNLRQCAKFDEAEKLYLNIINDDSTKDLSDAYWGLFLCEQNILFEYSDDDSGKAFPSFYNINSSDITKSKNLKKALEYSEKFDKEKYNTFKNLSDIIKKDKEKFFDIFSSQEQYDIFICFKNTGKDGKYTEDRQQAYDLYNTLKGIGYNVFMSEESLKHIKSNYSEYEPHIFHALYTSKTMLLLCSDKDYINSQWLKNEWSRFCATKGENALIPIFLDKFNPIDLPANLKKIQGIDRNKIDFFDILKTRISPTTKKTKERKKLVETIEIVDRKIASGSKVKSADEQTFIEVADKHYTEKNFKSAITFYKKALEINPDNQHTIINKLYSENGVNNDDDFAKKYCTIADLTDFKNALGYFSYGKQRDNYIKGIFDNCIEYLKNSPKNTINKSQNNIKYLLGCMSEDNKNIETMFFDYAELLKSKKLISESLVYYNKLAEGNSQDCRVYWSIIQCKLGVNNDSDMFRLKKDITKFDEYNIAVILARKNNKELFEYYSNILVNQSTAKKEVKQKKVNSVLGLKYYIMLLISIIVFAAQGFMLKQNNGFDVTTHILSALCILIMLVMTIIYMKEIIQKNIVKKSKIPFLIMNVLFDALMVYNGYLNIGIWFIVMGICSVILLTLYYIQIYSEYISCTLTGATGMFIIPALLSVFISLILSPYNGITIALNCVMLVNYIVFISIVIGFEVQEEISNIVPMLFMNLSIASLMMTYGILFGCTNIWFILFSCLNLLIIIFILVAAGLSENPFIILYTLINFGVIVATLIVFGFTIMNTIGMAIGIILALSAIVTAIVIAD